MVLPPQRRNRTDRWAVTKSCCHLFEPLPFTRLNQILLAEYDGIASCFLCLSQMELGILFFAVKCLKRIVGASLVAQWLRVCLLMQGTRVRALAWEDPTCRGAAGPVSHNC